MVRHAGHLTVGNVYLMVKSNLLLLLDLIAFMVVKATCCVCGSNKNPAFHGISPFQDELNHLKTVKTLQEGAP